MKNKTIKIISTSLVLASINTTIATAINTSMSNNNDTLNITIDNKSEDNNYDTLKATQYSIRISEKIENELGIDKYIIQYAFAEAENYVDNYTPMNEYLTKVCLIISTMDIESNFEMITCTNTNGSIDYGIMQVNDCNEKEIREEFGDIVNNYKHDMRQNIKAGTWEVMKCYDKAKDKHSENVLFYHYNYYNRGLYFEQFKYNKHQANVRGNMFIDIFNKYSNIMEINL